VVIVIGKGGQKINEIRQQSQCQIRVTEPGTSMTPGVTANPEERLVTITGMPGAINVAVQLLYSVSLNRFWSVLGVPVQGGHVMRYIGGGRLALQLPPGPRRRAKGLGRSQRMCVKMGGVVLGTTLIFCFFSDSKRRSRRCRTMHKQCLVEERESDLRTVEANKGDVM
jgi:hypothetical protein